MVARKGLNFQNGSLHCQTYSGPQIRVRNGKLFSYSSTKTSADPERGDRGSGPPPGKSQVIWVSKGNEQLDPPWKKSDPPVK